MSAIASFYLVRNKDIDRLKDLATEPVGPVAGGKWHDPYWEFLFAEARELERFNWSGNLMMDAITFLLSRDAKIDDYSDKPLSDSFCETRESSMLVFRATPGKAFAQLIAANLPDGKELEAFLTSQEMTSPSGDNPPKEAVLDALRVLKNWLSQVDENHLGLLSIG